MNIALCHSGHNRHLLALVLVLTIAEQQVHTRLAGLSSHLACICNFHAEFASTLVNHQTTALEDCLHFAVIEVLEGDIVLQQRIEVALELQQFQQWLIFAGCCVHSGLVFSGNSGHFCLVGCYLRGQFLPFLFSNLRLLFGIGGCQPHLLQFGCAEPCIEFRFVVVNRCDDIGCQRCLGQRFLLYGYGSHGSLCGSKSDRVLFACHTAGNICHLLGFGIFLVEISNLQRIFLFQQHVRIAEHRAQIVGCSHNLIDTDLAVVVGVHQFQCLFTDLQTGGRAAEHRPHLLVQFAQVAKILTLRDMYAGVTTDGGECPFVSHIFVVLS